LQLNNGSLSGSRVIHDRLMEGIRSGHEGHR
jgi:hypothetical protein